MNETDNSGKSMMFTFGDAEPVLSKNPIDYLGILMEAGGRYYAPPIDLDGLADLMGANAYHGTILHFKKNMIMKWFVPTRFLSRADMSLLAMNFLVMGNGYLQQLRNPFGRTSRLKSLPAIRMRRGKDPELFFMVRKNGVIVEFEAGEVVQMRQPDLRQDIYGVPDYIGGIQSVLLSEEATLFRRKYYINGAHMGYILVTHDAGIDDETAKMIEEKVKNSKGPGNFRSLYMNIARTSSKEPVKIIPVGDIGTNDEFTRIKEITEREMLAMHRMPPGLSGIIPQNTSGFGDLEKLMKVYHELEITALQQPFLHLNELLGKEVVKFKEPVWTQAA